MKRISLLATLGHLATSQTAPYDIQRKFTASKRRMNTLDPRAPEAKRLILKHWRVLTTISIKIIKLFFRNMCLDKTTGKYVNKGETFQRMFQSRNTEVSQICTCLGQGTVQNFSPSFSEFSFIFRIILYYK